MVGNKVKFHQSMKNDAFSTKIFYEGPRKEKVVIFVNFLKFSTNSKFQ